MNIEKRDILDWRPEIIKLFLYLKFNADKKGEIKTTLRKLSSETKLTKQKIVTGLKNLQKKQLLIQVSRHDSTTITMISTELKTPTKTPTKTPKEKKEGEFKPTPDHQKDFSDFMNFINTYAPDVNKLTEPFTIEQFLKIKEKNTVQDIKEIILKMHNWKPLLTKSKSAYLTALTWLKKSNNIKWKKKQ